MPALLHSPYAWQKPPAGSQIDPGHPLSGGLVAAFMALENSGIITTDSSQHQGSGTMNSVTWISGPRFSPCWSFARANSSWISIPDNPLLTPPKLISVSCWFRQIVVTNPRILVHKGNGKTFPGSAWELGFDNANNKMVFECSTQSAWVAATDTDANTDEANWYHVVGTCDDVGAVKLYVNARLKASASGAVNMPNDTNVLSIGAQSNSPSATGYSGLIAAVMVYNRTLTYAEILQLYEEPYAMLRGPDVLPRYYLNAFAGQGGAAAAATTTRGMARRWGGKYL